MMFINLLQWTLYFSIVSVVLADSFIVGGSETSVRQYPSIASMIFSFNCITYQQGCGGTIINNRSILTAAHCIFGFQTIQWRARVGSSYANAGGIVYNAAALKTHPNYNAWTIDSDIGILRTATPIAYVYGLVLPATLSGSHYGLADNEPVWAAGWGLTEVGGLPSEVLNHVQIWTINQEICRRLYADRNKITDNMLCAGWLGVGGRDQCNNDSGGPLFHAHVLVGICSWGAGCGDPYYPGVNTRVSRFISWILQNA